MYTKDDDSTIIIKLCSRTIHYGYNNFRNSRIIRSQAQGLGLGKMGISYYGNSRKSKTFHIYID